MACLVACVAEFMSFSRLCQGMSIFIRNCRDLNPFLLRLNICGLKSTEDVRHDVFCSKPPLFLFLRRFGGDGGDRFGIEPAGPVGRGEAGEIGVMAFAVGLKRGGQGAEAFKRSGSVKTPERPTSSSQIRPGVKGSKRIRTRSRPPAGRSPARKSRGDQSPPAVKSAWRANERPPLSPSTKTRTGTPEGSERSQARKVKELAEGGTNGSLDKIADAPRTVNRKEPRPECG